MHANEELCSKCSWVFVRGPDGPPSGQKGHEWSVMPSLIVTHLLFGYIGIFFSLFLTPASFPSPAPGLELQNGEFFLMKNVETFELLQSNVSIRGINDEFVGVELKTQFVIIDLGQRFSGQ